MGKELEDKVLNLYKTLSATKIPSLVNTSLANVYRILKKYNVTRKFNVTNKLTWQKLGDWENAVTLSKLYVDDELSTSDIARKFGVTKNAIRLALHRFNIPIRDIKVRNKLENYREKISRIQKSVMSTPHMKEIISANSKKAWKDRGYKLSDLQKEVLSSDEYREKMRQVMLRRHKTSFNRKIRPLISSGLKRAWRENSVWRSRISDMLRQYVPGSMLRIKQDPISFARWKESLHRVWSDPEYKKKQRDISKKVWSNPEYRARMYKMYHSEEFIGKSISKRDQQSVISSQQRVLYDLLGKLGIDFVPEKRVGFYSFDCFLPKFNILIEVNGDYWHNLPKAVRNDKSKSSYIERYFPELRLKIIWEHEFKCQDRIISLLKYWCGLSRVNEVDFGKLVVGVVPAELSGDFIKKFHYLGKPGNSVLRVGFWLGSELVGVVLFGQVTRLESAVRLGLKPGELLELTRFCIHPAFQVKNLASFMLSRAIKFVDKSKYRCLISFADSTFGHKGTIYKASNWTLDGVVSPSYWYVDRDGFVMHKKTLWDHAKKMGLSEGKFARKYGYVKKFGLEKYRFIYWL